MKTILKLFFLAVIFYSLLAISNLVGFTPKNPSISIKTGVSSEYANVSAILQNKCVDCHSPGMTRMPVYADFPIARQLIQKDINAGNKRFTLTRKIYMGEKPFTTLMLNRLENVVQNDLMPPKLYLSMHWNGRLNTDEKQTILGWISTERKARTKNDEAISHDYDNEPVQPIPLSVNLNSEKVSLGKKLFFDTRLSADNTVSCASCHDLTKGGTDQSRFATGIKGQMGAINSPTVFNARYNLAQFWDGRARDLQEQAAAPVVNPAEMGAQWADVISKLEQDKEYNQTFLKLYPAQGLSKTSVTDAIAVFEQSLITPDSRFDQYLRGNKDVLDSHEKQGYQLFKQYCTSCHFGMAVGGQSFEKMGYVQDYFKMRGGELTRADNGRFNVTGNEEDRHVFKVPVLRNIELTYPYFHDGSVNDLGEAVRIMGMVQMGKDFSQQEVDQIVAFLKTLTGKYDGIPLSKRVSH